MILVYKLRNALRMRAWLGIVLSLLSYTVESRWAIVVTLAGQSYLSKYFEWSCRSIGASRDLVDMLVFHEGNEQLKNIICAENVKYIDLGKNGMARLTVSEILSFSNSSDVNKEDLIELLSQVIQYVPRFLVEIKPMSGSLFRDWLLSYSHWSYTDPDIIWGNLTEWIPLDDASNFDIITLGKLYDASRLFVRGQFALHRNVDSANTIWHSLSYFSSQDFAKRVSLAARLVKRKEEAIRIFASCFHSAEGWYSQAVFDSSVRIKIIGRGFDDFSRDPVILSRGQLTRCRQHNLGEKLHQILSADPSARYNTTVYDFPAIQSKPVSTFHHKSACRMQWLPTALRFCIAIPVYDKTAALAQDKQTNVRMDRLGESWFDGKRWLAHDERLGKRQFTTRAAFYHFRHWDDYGSKGVFVDWGEVQRHMPEIECMVLYLTPDKIMSFESCELVAKKADAGLLEESEADIAASVEKGPVVEVRKNEESVVLSEKKTGDEIKKKDRKRRKRLRRKHGGD